MKKIKLFLCVALFGAISFGAFSTYDYLTMSVEEKALLENVEALTQGEGGSGTTYSCYEVTIPGHDTDEERWCHECTLKKGRLGHSGKSTCVSYL